MPKLETHLVYGETSAGKTKWLELLAYWLMERTGLPSRLYTCEHYGTARAAVESGVLEVWQFDNRPFPFETSRQACEGMWPADPLDPTSPVSPTPDLAKRYAGMFYEGLATIGDYLMGSYATGGLADRAAKGARFGRNDDPAVLQDGKTQVGGNSMGQYMFGQPEMIGLIKRTQRLPCEVGVWTAHQRLAQSKTWENKQTGTGVKTLGAAKIGPEVIGEALTPTIGRNFASVLHLLTLVRSDPSAKVPVTLTRRLYTREHFDPDVAVSRVLYQAKNPVGDEIPEFFSPPDPKAYFEALEAAQAKRREERAKWKEGLRP